MTNSQKIRGRIAEMGYNITSLSTALGMSRPSLRKKIEGESDFRASEIERICSVLQIPLDNVGLYFFAANVPNMETLKESL